MSDPVRAADKPYATDVEEGKTYYWCSCGKSSTQPLCDGSHQGTEYSPIIENVTEKKTLAWCGCKHSSNGPFCDGTHAKL